MLRRQDRSDECSDGRFVLQVRTYPARVEPRLPEGLLEVVAEAALDPGPLRFRRRPPGPEADQRLIDQVLLVRVGREPGTEAFLARLVQALPVLQRLRPLVGNLGEHVQ